MMEPQRWESYCCLLAIGLLGCGSKNADAVAGSESLGASERLPTIVLHAGFRPDPVSFDGQAVAKIPASDFHKRCKGFVSETPNLVIETKTAFQKLHVFARSAVDSVLVVRKPNGEILCADDSDKDHNPMVYSSFGAGKAEVFVGNKKQGETLAFTVGVSEVHWKPSSVALPVSKAP
ncbi:MAG: hypothetical protein R3A47_00250 [Polyangiales bacterium]